MVMKVQIVMDYGGQRFKKKNSILIQSETRTDIIDVEKKKRYSRCTLTMVHELAHIIDPGAGTIKPSQWAKARKLDKKKFASEYAKTNSDEDFAESMVSWIVVRHKSDKISKSDVVKFEKFIPNRFKLFDEMNFNVYPL